MPGKDVPNGSPRGEGRSPHQSPRSSPPRSAAEEDGARDTQVPLFTGAAAETPERCRFETARSTQGDDDGVGESTGAASAEPPLSPIVIADACGEGEPEEEPPDEEPAVLSQDETMQLLGPLLLERGNRVTFEVLSDACTLGPRGRGLVMEASDTLLATYLPSRKFQVSGGEIIVSEGDYLVGLFADSVLPLEDLPAILTEIVCITRLQFHALPASPTSDEIREQDAHEHNFDAAELDAQAQGASHSESLLVQRDAVPMSGRRHPADETLNFTEWLLSLLFGPAAVLELRSEGGRSCACCSKLLGNPQVPSSRNAQFRNTGPLDQDLGAASNEVD